MPPQLPEYHFLEAPVPNEPPNTVNILEFPEHRGSGFADTPVGAPDDV